MNINTFVIAVTGTACLACVITLAWNNRNVLLKPFARRELTKKVKAKQVIRYELDCLEHSANDLNKDVVKREIELLYKELFYINERIVVLNKYVNQ